MPFKTYACKRLICMRMKRKCYSHTEQRVLIMLRPARQGSCPDQTGALFKSTPRVHRRWKGEVLQTNHLGGLPPPQQPGCHPGACGLRYPPANPAMKPQERKPAVRSLRHSTTPLSPPWLARTPPRDPSRRSEASCRERV